MPPRIYLTGPIAVERDGNLLFDERQLAGRQGRLAFAYLAVNRLGVAKSALVDVLWGDDPPREVDVTLAAILSRLRSLLKNGGLDASIDAQHGSIVLRLPADTWVDLEAAANAIDEAEGVVRREEWKAAWSHANVAAVIARRPFLASEEAPWIQSWRERLSAVLVRALQCLSVVSERTSQPALAVQYASDIISIEPYREHAYQSLMRLHARTGNPAEALRVYEGCRMLLREELGASPSADSEKLHLAILRGEPV